MTIADNAPRVAYVATSGQTAFTYPFEIIAQTDLVVLQEGVTLALTTHYTVSGVGDESGGTVTLVTGATTGDEIVIYRDMAISRTTDYGPGAKLNPNTLDADLDRVMLGLQQVERDVERTLRLAPADITDPVGDDFVLPLPALRAGKYIAFDADGKPVASVGTGTDNTLRTDLAASGGSTLVGFLPYGSGAVARTVQAVLRELRQSLANRSVVFDDSTDNSSALETALDDGPHIGFVVPVGVARFATGLTWTDPYVGLYGVSPPVFLNDTEGGPVLRYTGTGTALTIGEAPDTNGNFLEGVQIENVRFRLATNTTRGLRLWHLNDADLRHVHVYGSSGASRYGIVAEGCINTVLDNVEVGGQEGAGGVPANYLDNGLRIINGSGGSISTTLTIRKGYFHYCLTGVHLGADGSGISFEDTIFEANTTGLVIGSTNNVQVTRCWFEANGTTDIYFTGDSQSVVEACNINAGARQLILDGAAPKLVVLRNCKIFTTHGTPYLFNPAGSSLAGMRLVLDNNTLPASFNIGGVGIDWRDVQVVGMRTAVYRFRQTGAAAGAAYNMPQDNGSTYATPMPEKGHVLASYTYYRGANITAGWFAVNVNKNGVAIANLNSPAFTATPGRVDGQYYRDTFAAGDTIQPYLVTDAAFAAIGGEFITEIIVAFGEDGL